MSRNRSSIRRAKSYRWEPPAVETPAVDLDVQPRWDVARAKSIAWATETAGDPSVVYLDTETTGFGTKAEIVDIAVVSSGGELLYESLVRPERHIPRDASAIHGIYDADVRSAPRWDEVYTDLSAILHDKRIVVYNVVFDRQMVQQACERYALPPPQAEWECAMKKYAGFHGNWDAGRRWFSFVKLEKAVLTFGAAPGGHRAAADTFACRAVVLGMAATLPPAPGAGESALPLPEAPRRAWHALPRDAAELTPLGTLARWSHASKEFRTLLEQTPVALRDRTGACGSWSVRQVAAHAVGWEWEGSRRLRLLANDESLPGAIYDVDRVNAANVEVRAKSDWVATLDELARASRTFGLAAARLPDSPHTREWLIGRASDFEEHTDGIRRWLDQVTDEAEART